MSNLKNIYRALSDPATPHWVRNALTVALTLDPCDAANAAETLANLLSERANEALKASMATAALVKAMAPKGWASIEAGEERE